MSAAGGNGAEMGFPRYTARRSVGGGALSRGYGTSRTVINETILRISVSRMGSSRTECLRFGSGLRCDPCGEPFDSLRLLLLIARLKFDIDVSLPYYLI